jgi:hypothetical protein
VWPGPDDLLAVAFDCCHYADMCGEDSSKETPLVAKKFVLDKERSLLFSFFTISQYK